MLIYNKLKHSTCQDTPQTAKREWQTNNSNNQLDP